MVCVYPMIADFVSMYPSIISSAKISPESIDYCDKDCLEVPRYSHKLVLLSYILLQNTIYMGITMYGYNIQTSLGCTSFTLIGKYSNSISEPLVTSTTRGLQQLCIELACNVVH
jgi:hypothetical protein